MILLYIYINSLAVDIQRKRDDNTNKVKGKRFSVDTSGMTDKEKVMDSYDNETPDSFLKEVMYECEGVTKSEKITIRKNAAIHANDMSMLAESGYDRREWRRLSFNLNRSR